MSIGTSIGRAVTASLVLIGVCMTMPLRAAGIAGVVTGTEAGNPALAGASVTAVDVGTFSSTFTQTDGSGAYHLANLPPATYVLFVDAPGRTSELYDNVPCPNGNCDVGAATLLTLANAATELTGKDFALDGAEFLSIELRNADTGQRIAGQWTVLMPDNTVANLNASASAPTVVNVPGGGAVRIAGDSSQCGPASDTRCLAERYPDTPCMNLGCDLAAGTAITVPAGSNVGGLTLTLARGGSVIGSVHAGDAPTNPLESVSVRLHRGDGSMALETTTLADGTYTFDGLEPGPFFAVAQAPSGYLGQLYNGIDCALGACTVSSGTALVTTSGTVVSGVDFLLPRGGAIAGRLREQSIDLSIPGAQIDVFDAQGNAVAQTSSIASGQFLTPALPAGSYTLRASANNYVTTLFPDVPCPGGSCNPLTGQAIAVTVPQTTTLADWRLPRVAVPLQPRLLYLNRCVGGCTVFRGNTDNAITHQSSIVPGTHTIPAFAYGDAAFDALVQCTRRVYAPYFVTVTTTDPGNVPHRELMIGGLPSAIGQPSGVQGVSPFACGAGINNAIAFVFSANHPNDTAELCWTTTHEAGHLFGLDHELHQPDSMDYALITDQIKHFTDAEASCFNQNAPTTPIPCNCGSVPTQNSDHHLGTEVGRERVFADGMGDDPWALPTGAAPLMQRSDRTVQACGTRTDRYTPASAAWWIGGPEQIAVPLKRE